MVLIKILKRKDASSIIIAILVAMIVGQFLAFIFHDLASILAGTKQEFGELPGGPGGPGWEGTYLQPFILMLLQLIALELLAWVTIIFLSALAKKPAKKK